MIFILINIWMQMGDKWKFHPQKVWYGSDMEKNEEDTEIICRYFLRSSISSWGKNSCNIGWRISLFKEILWKKWYRKYNCPLNYSFN